MSSNFNNIKLTERLPLHKSECIACKNKKYCCISYESIMIRKPLHSCLERDRNKIRSKRR
jgi:hypothetical protein